MSIRRLASDDLAGCVALCRDRDWLAQARQWRLLLKESQSFGIDAPDGDGLAGSVVLTEFGDMAAVGMMLVATRYGGKGLGRALLEHALDAAGPATVFLTATAMGRPLYSKLGFVPIRRSAKFIGTFVPDPGTPAVAKGDLATILRLDKAAFGADRGFLLRRLADEPDTVIRVLPDGSGYALAWDAGDTVMVGPVVAPTTRQAGELIAGLAADIGGPIRVDIDPDRPGLPEWLTAHGVPQAGETAFMVRGSWSPAPDAADLHALLSPAVGLHRAASQARQARAGQTAVFQASAVGHQGLGESRRLCETPRLPNSPAAAPASPTCPPACSCSASVSDVKCNFCRITPPGWRRSARKMIMMAVTMYTFYRADRYSHHDHHGAGHDPGARDAAYSLPVPRPARAAPGRTR